MCVYALYLKIALFSKVDIYIDRCICKLYFACYLEFVIGKFKTSFALKQSCTYKKIILFGSYVFV